MKWTNAQLIAEELYNHNASFNPKTVRFFINLINGFVKIEDFDDDPNKSNESILEAILLKWLDEFE